MSRTWRHRQQAAWEQIRAEYLQGSAVGAESQLDEAAEALRSAVRSTVSRLDRAVFRGDKALALCPFHMDRRVGSFVVNARTGWYTCFACDARGGIFQLMQQVGADTAELRETLKGVNFRALSDFIEGTRSDATWFTLPDSLLARYDSRPLQLVERGHPRSLIDALEIGFDPHRERITYPVRRVTGELVAIQTRATREGDRLRWKFYRQEILDDLHDMDPGLVGAYSLADYNPPRNSVFFNEHNVLAGLIDGRVRRPVVLCEGPGHALRVLAAGYPCVGSFGVSLAQQQLERLLGALGRAQRWSGARPTLIVATDGDRAGRMSAFTTALRIGARADVRIARLPRVETPDGWVGLDPEDLTVQELRPLLLSAERMHSYLSRDDQDSHWAAEATQQFAKKIVEEEARAARREAYLQKRQRSEHESIDRDRRPSKATHPFSGSRRS